MNENSRARLGCGAALVLLGAWLLALRMLPALDDWVQSVVDWPMFVIGAGILLLLIGLLVFAPGMAIPAAIVGGIGGLLYWQSATGNWESWAYAWTLILLGLFLLGKSFVGGKGGASSRS